MLDINGNEVKVGDKCKFYFDLRDEWVVGTVRNVVTYTYHYYYPLTVCKVKVDNGDPSNPDISENGYTMAAMVETNRIEIIDDYNTGYSSDRMQEAEERLWTLKRKVAAGVAK